MNIEAHKKYIKRAYEQIDDEFTKFRYGAQIIGYIDGVVSYTSAKTGVELLAYYSELQNEKKTQTKEA